MSQPISSLMLKFNFEKLIEIFFERFLQEYGTLKFEEISEKIKASKQVSKYLDEVGYNLYRPTSKGITAQLNTVAYFIFCKGETLCIGSLITLINWNILFNKNQLVLSEQEITKVVTDIIIDCYNVKLSKSGSIFTRFFEEIKNISNKSETHHNDEFDSWLYNNDEFDYGERLD